jgi:hypothetical protein
VKFVLLLKATKKCAIENTYPPRNLKNFHNKTYENKKKNQRSPKHNGQIHFASQSTKTR